MYIKIIGENNGSACKRPLVQILHYWCLAGYLAVLKTLRRRDIIIWRAARSETTCQSAYWTTTVEQLDRIHRENATLKIHLHRIQFRTIFKLNTSKCCTILYHRLQMMYYKTFQLNWMWKTRVSVLW